MKRVRLMYNEQPCWGELKGDIILLDNGAQVAEKDADYLAPVTPSKILAVHLNYPDRLAAMLEKGALTEAPCWASYFLKAPSALIGSRHSVGRPSGTHFLNYEGEIALVIGRRAERVKLGSALDYIYGVSAANDMVLHDFQSSDRGSMARAKNQKGFCPIGNCVVTTDEIRDLRAIHLNTYVNGTKVQHGVSGDLIYFFDYLIADLSRLITLEPGDVILTGSPNNSRPVEPGDTVTVELEGLCRLENTIHEYHMDWEDFGARPEGAGYAVSG